MDFLKLWCPRFAQTFSRNRLFICILLSFFFFFLVLSLFGATAALEEFGFITSLERVIVVLSYAQPPGALCSPWAAAFLSRWALPESLSPSPRFSGWNQMVTRDKMIFIYPQSSCSWYLMHWQILPKTADILSPSSIRLCSPSFLVWQLILTIFQEPNFFLNQMPLKKKKNDWVSLGIRGCHLRH